IPAVPFTVRFPAPCQIPPVGFAPTRFSVPPASMVLELVTVRAWPPSTLSVAPFWIVMLLTVGLVVSTLAVPEPALAMMTSSLLVGSELGVQLEELLQLSLTLPFQVFVVLKAGQETSTTANTAVARTKARMRMLIGDRPVRLPNCWIISVRRFFTSSCK